MTVFQNIRRIIKLKRSTQEEVAENIGLSDTGLSKSLKKESLKVTDLIKIANFLKVDVCEFFKEEKEYSLVEKSGLTAADEAEEYGSTHEKRISKLEIEVEKLKKEINKLKS